MRYRIAEFDLNMFSHWRGGIVRLKKLIGFKMGFYCTNSRKRTPRDEKYVNANISSADNVLLKDLPYASYTEPYNYCNWYFIPL